MIDTDKYEGHTPVWYLHGETGAWWVQSDFTTHDDFVVAEVRSQNEVDAQLIADAPLLLDLLIDARRMVKQLHAMLDEDDGFKWAINNIGEQEMIWWNQEASE